MKIQLITMATVWLFSCQAQNNFIAGKFEQAEYSDYKLIFKKDSFEYINTHKPFDLSAYPCRGERIAFGIWSRDEDSNLLRLKSPWYIISSILETNVSELNDNTDSLTFIVSNPIEKHHRLFNEIVRDLKYGIVLETNNFKLDDFLTKRFEQNTIQIKRPAGTQLKSLTVFIEPANNMGRPINVTSIETIRYDVKNENSNKFIIEIPRLTYEFISSLRLDDDFVKIIDSNRLEWKGKFYSRKSKEKGSQ
jgi:hypothetical protein